jgi:hypothetical protein
MKNTIVVLMVLLANKPVFAQLDPAKITRSTNFFQTENKTRSLIHNKQWDSKRFMELYNQYHATGKNTAIRPGTFMDGLSVYPAALPVEIGRNANNLYHRYAAGMQQPSDALQVLGFFGAITAFAFAPKQYRPDHFPLLPGNRGRYIYTDKNAAVDAYLEAAYRQHNQ